MGRVIVVGSLNVDLEVHVPGLPRPGEKVMGERLSRFAGGKGGNQAVAARQAGSEVVMVGSVGDDDAGRQYLNRLAGMGIALKVNRVTHTPTGHALITTDPSGHNGIVVVPGANLQIERRPLDPIRGKGSEDVLLTQLETPVETIAEVVQEAKNHDMRVVVQVSPYTELPAEVIEAADPLIIHIEDAPALEATGHRPKSLLITRGKDGVTWDGVDYHGEIVPDDEVVDTIGAGDAFVGTIAASLQQGLDRDQSVARALHAASINVRRFGAQPNPRL